MRQCLSAHIDSCKMRRELILPSQVPFIAFQQNRSFNLSTRPAVHIDGLMYDAVQLCLVAGGQDSEAGSPWHVGFVSWSSIEPPQIVILVQPDPLKNGRLRRFGGERLLVGYRRPSTATVSSTILMVH